MHGTLRFCAFVIFASAVVIGCGHETTTIRRETVQTIPPPTVVEKRTTVQTIPASPVVEERSTTIRSGSVEHRSETTQ
ncbi:MAG: hypothetical protein HY271_00955 [Deltaproteobacteria bacterium]|nr:hypothetical protein [Deltaproteobacteria bacterium]